MLYKSGYELYMKKPFCKNQDNSPKQKSEHLNVYFVRLLGPVHEKGVFTHSVYP